VFGNSDREWTAEACQWTARDVQSKLALGQISARTYRLAAQPGEVDSCKLVLGPNLRPSPPRRPAADQGQGGEIPSNVRYGSHRVTLEDAERTLQTFADAEPVQSEYPLYVSYVLFRQPRVERKAVPAGMLSQICSARPARVAPHVPRAPAHPPSFSSPHLLAAWRWLCFLPSAPKSRAKETPRTRTSTHPISISHSAAE